MIEMSNARAVALEHFIAAAGWGDAVRRPMGADWSQRRYERLLRGHTSAVLMDAPGPAAAQVAPFVRIGALLRELSLLAPQILAQDLPAGLLLIEDFGDDSHAALLESGSAPDRLYEAATDVLIHLHRQFDAAAAPDLPRYDAVRFRDQVMLFADAYLPAALNRAVSAEERIGLAAAWDEVLSPVLAGPQSLLLRDYHPGNLMRIPGEGARAVGLLDFQDGGIGPIAYDLVSLLEDARRDVPERIQRAMLARYRSAFADLDADGFAHSYAVLGAIRHARIIGRVAELASAGTARQLDFLPRVWGQFEAKLAQPALAPVRHWIDRLLPDDRGLGKVMERAA